MKAVKVKVIKREKLNFWERTYLLPIFQGMGVTLRHLLVNLFRADQMQTVSYPDQKKVMPKGYRGKHRLTKHDDGSVKCVACMMCVTACPADCIHIEAAEHDNPAVEKFPEIFEIDLLRCVYCAYCVEACPCDAIRMDSGIYTIFATKREDFLIDKEGLLNVKPQYPEDARPKQGMPPFDQAATPPLAPPSGRPEAGSSELRMYDPQSGDTQLP